MMDCRNSLKYVKDYVMGELSEETTEAIRLHLKTCEACRNSYEEHLRTDRCINSMTASNEVVFTSSTTEILHKIDTNRYTRKYSNKFMFFIRRNSVRYASSFAALVLIAFLGFFGVSYFKNNSGIVPTSHGNNGTSLSEKEVKEVQNTLTNFVKKYYVVTKEDIAVSKKVMSGMSAEEWPQYVAMGEKYHDEMSNYITAQALNWFIGNRSWYGRANTRNIADYTMEVKNIVVTEKPMSDNQAVFNVRFNIIKKDFEGKKIAQKDVSKDLYLLKEGGKWKISERNSFNINDDEFKNFNIN